MEYRNLTDAEIQTLEARGCEAENWKRVFVRPEFRPQSLRNVLFSGENRLGRFDAKATLRGGVELPSGIYNAALHDCRIGDNVFIRNVPGRIAAYDIETEVVIEDVSFLAMEGESSFGNGLALEPLNEGGGREVRIFDRLTAQIAYLQVVYRDRPKIRETLEKMIAAYAEKRRSARGFVGRGARLVNCGAIVNVRIGPAATIQGALKLAEGSVNSSLADPIFIGEGVQAEKFIMASGANVSGGAILDRCFVGQGVHLGKQFSAKNSVFFANCAGFHGEACALFAGPYTVTHHKSTLLIAGMFSFYNAGSGTNQNNHMYKLGPVHQGILERGGKTGSFSYLLWSSRLGAFSTVIGKHFRKFDASDFPFSYLMEDRAESILVPAANLFTVGTRRDGEKWPKRDLRKDPDTLDLIHFAVFSPYTAQKMIVARELLARLDETAPDDADFVDYGTLRLTRARLDRGRALYALGLRAYWGERIVKRLERCFARGDRAVAREFTEADKRGLGRWLDWCGLLLPDGEARKLTTAVAAEKFPDLGALETALRDLYARYEEWEWGWIVDVYAKELGKQPDQITVTDMKKAVSDWQKAATESLDLILNDVEKEFNASVRIGFGLDGDRQAAEADFAAVRGSFDDNKYVKGLRQERAKIETRAVALLKLLDSAT